MAQKKIDGVIETVHYLPDGLIEIVRIFESRGPSFSDRLIISRDELMSRIRNGKRYFTGKRVPYLGGTFEFGQLVQINKVEGKEYLVVAESTEAGDNLGSLPVI